MVRNHYKIFSEGRISNLNLKNRLVRSATCEYKMTPEGHATDAIIDIYRNLAQGGIGMIITGVMAVARSGKGVPGQACAFGDEHIAEIAKIADIVHKTDDECKIIAQLGHSGRQVTHDDDIAECVGPSALPSPILIKTARELTVTEVESIIKSFADAIARVKKAGFDGAQLHAAHGYLLSSFLSPYTNRRNDRFGGSIKNRVRIIQEIVTLARQTVGGFPILIKMNCDDHVEGGISEDTFPELIKEIENTGVDAIEVSGGMWDCLACSEDELGFLPLPIPESRTRINRVEKQSYYYDYVKDIGVSLPLILVGGHRNVERLERLLQEGKVDFLSFSRPLIAEPDLPNRWLEGLGSENTRCVSCNACLVLKDNCSLGKTGFDRGAFEKGFLQGWRAVFK